MSPARRLLCAFTLTLLLPTVHANTYWVGRPDDQDCTHSFAGAVAAANANAGLDYIILGFDQAGVAASITDALEIWGGFEGCGAAATTPGLRSTLIGDAINNVLFVDAGDNLTLRDIEITNGGNAALLAGGGIWKNGAGYLTLYNTVVYGNKAQFGGGIAVTGANAMALLYAGSRVESNIAQRGGGVYVDEAALRIDNFDTAIRLNSTLLGAQGERFGGGIYATGTASRPAEVSAFSLTYEFGEPHPPSQGFRLSLNVAHDGGGLFATGATTVTLAETTISQNSATRYGGGMHLAEGATLQMYRRFNYSGATTVCDGLFGCNKILNNYAEFNGGGLSMSNGVSAYVGQALIAGNISNLNAGSAISASIPNPMMGASNRLTLEATVIAGNECRENAGICNTIGMFGATNYLRMRHVTMADNLSPNIAVASPEISIHPSAFGDADVQIRSSVIEPMAGDHMFSANDPSIFSTDCVMGPGPFPNGTRSLQRTPPYAFVARAALDYRPADGDPAIDGCDGSAIPADTMLVNAPDFSLYGYFDDPYVPNRLGAGSTHDIGAFEMMPLLRDGFE